VVEAGRRVLSGFVLLAAGWLAIWVAAFRVGHLALLLAAGKATRVFDNSGFDRCAVGTNYCNAVRPEWTIPGALGLR
jgi:hypothetical protein